MPGSLRRLIVLAAFVLPLGLFLFSRPRVLFYVLIFLIFSNVHFYIDFLVFKATYIAAIAAWILLALEKRQLVLHDPLFGCLTALFCILLFQSIAAAWYLDRSIYRLKTFTQTMAFIFLTVQFIRDRRDFRVFLMVVSAAVLSANFLPMIVPPPQVYTGAPSIISSQGVFRFEGLLFEPNLIANLQLFIIPVFLFFAFMYRKPVVRAIALLAVAGSILIVVLSFSRGGFLSLAFLMLVLLYVERRNRILLWAGISVIIITLLLAPPSYYIRIGSIMEAISSSSEDYPVYTRLETMRSALEIGIRNPIFGVGLENFRTRSAVFTSVDLSVHNSFLQIFSELGIFALGFFVAMIVYNIRLLKDLIKQKEREASYIGRFLMIQMLAVIFNSLFIPVAYDTVLWFTLLLPSLAHFVYRPSVSSGRK
jgi:O-antigen ligase